VTARAGRRSIASLLLAWFDREKRELPWRGTKDPYAIWVSEIMLQQTTVQTVLPRYRPFLRRFPTIRSLAKASLDEVLAAWSGLGYYARARNLHRAARLVVERHRGRLPDDLEALRALPGMGEYMAKAVAAIAFGRSTLPMDANIRRVVSRLFASDDPASRLAEVISPARPGDSIAAIFDLGQTICRPRDPDCPACPVERVCRARASGSTSDFPSRAARAPLRPYYRCAAAVLSRGRILMRRREKGWLAGMWELPGEEADRLAVARARFRRHFPEAAPLPVATIEQPIAGRRVRVEVYPAPGAPRGARDHWMTAAEIEGSASPSLTKKIVRRISQRRTISK
jgi:A/G-specific adenine glycosylase